MPFMQTSQGEWCRPSHTTRTYSVPAGEVLGRGGKWELSVGNRVKVMMRIQQPMIVVELRMRVRESKIPTLTMEAAMTLGTMMTLAADLVATGRGVVEEVRYLIRNGN